MRVPEHIIYVLDPRRFLAGGGLAKIFLAKSPQIAAVTGLSFDGTFVALNA